jgi:hypothetical protein
MFADIIQSARLGLAAEHPDPYRAAAPTTLYGCTNTEVRVASSRKTVNLPEYSGLLLQRGKFWSSDPKTGIECIEALAEHYRVGRAGVLLPARKMFDPSKSIQERAEDWMSLAIHLATDVVPAFRQIRRGGAPKRSHTRSSPSFPHAHEARLVQLTLSWQQTLKLRGLPSSRKDAFRELIKLGLGKKHPHWRFSAYSKPSSLAQAWKKIPKQVKENPASYAPEDEVLQVVEPVPFGAFGMGDWLIRQERNRLTTILPPVRG